MLIKNRRMFLLGIFIIIIPFLGFPSSWKVFLTVASGFGLALMSVKFSLPKKIKQIKKKEKSTSVFTENFPMDSQHLSEKSSLEKENQNVQNQ